MCGRGAAGCLTSGQRRGARDQEAGPGPGPAPWQCRCWTTCREPSIRPLHLCASRAGHRRDTWKEAGLGALASCALLILKDAQLLSERGADDADSSAFSV